MLPHEKLHVYRKAIDFIGEVSAAVALWDKRHAVADQFGRASDSLVLNVAEGARLRPGRAKLRALDFALGSCLECAACLDVAWIKEFLQMREAGNHKRRLCEIARMVVGLGKAWSAWRLQEDSPPYHVRPKEDDDQPLFFHETLDVYRAGLDLVRWMVTLPGATALPTRSHRQIDEGITSILLNIAEGNGRYSEVDHRRFLDLAAAAAVKVAAGLDLATRKGLWDRPACEPAKALLERIMAMLSRM
jgi:four helix bundle protein